MNFAGHLASTQLLDCTGQVTHTLTLLPNGTVEVVTPSVTATVDPTSKSILHPPRVQLPQQILDHAAALARVELGP